MSGKFVFSVAERRRERALKDEDSDVPEEVTELVNSSDDEGRIVSMWNHFIHTISNN